jgi:hypothetical protein
MTLNLNKAYRRKICKLAHIDQSEFDYYYKKAFRKLSCDPTNVPLIVKAIKLMARRDKLHNQET